MPERRCAPHALLVCASLLAAALFSTPREALAQGADSAGRGRLLYDTHCVACHTQQMHWREQRLATDWAALVTLVRAWQGREGLGWSDADIEAVAAHLNETIYKHPRARVVAGR